MTPMRRPPMIPVTSPDAGGIPDAIAMPMHRGSATRNTTIDARKSWTIVARVALVIGDPSDDPHDSCRRWRESGPAEGVAHPLFGARRCRQVGGLGLIVV